VFSWSPFSGKIVSRFIACALVGSQGGGFGAVLKGTSVISGKTFGCFPTDVQLFAHDRHSLDVQVSLMADVWRESMESIWQDCGWRPNVVNKPGFTDRRSTLALGIGPHSLFSVVNALLFRPLPFRDRSDWCGSPVIPAKPPAAW